jgi:hypothetical protein
MSESRRLWMVILALFVGTALFALALPEMAPSGPLTSNRKADGLQAAWRYLGARGWDVQTWRRPLTELPPDGEGVLVLAAPALKPYRSQDLDAVRRWLMVGGDVVVLLDGTTTPGPGAWPLLDALDIERNALVEDPDAPAPELPQIEDEQDLAQVMRQEMLLAPVEGAGDGPVRIRRVMLRVRPDPDEDWVLRSGDGEVGVRLRRREQGRVAIVDDRSLLMNGWFARPGSGNAAAVEDLLSRLDADRGVLYDEWHLGLMETTAGGSTDTGGRRALDLLLGHLLLIYAGIAWAAGRRFGPGRAADPPPRTSVDRDLRALGALHARAGHAADLGQRLLDLAHRHARAPLDLPRTFSGGPADLLALARQVAALQADGRL